MFCLSFRTDFTKCSACDAFCYYCAVDRNLVTSIQLGPSHPHPVHPGMSQVAMSRNCC